MTTNAPEKTILPSFAKGEWQAADAPQKTAEVFDANTGELITHVSSDGVDISGMVDYARTVGQKSLGDLTIHERALKLKELAQYLNGRKEELYTISYRTGATKRDHGVDTDGGISTLFVYSSKGRREMPNSNVILDGKTEGLSRDGSFIGTHVYTRIPGVAVQINAFNFPIWGMLEKFAPSFIAGVPTIVKPATSTGYVTEAAVRMMLESGILPEGSLQLISGSTQDLFDHLDYRDHVAFTGSLNTANTLRAHESVQNGGV
ncbi:MAG: aldehyde dehydrogenase family protein, partial [Yaniella sp.]|nr:aldehyde dehydrogenase family protein [Yaniella sp.]